MSIGRPYSRIRFSGGGTTQNDIIVDSNVGLSRLYGAANEECVRMSLIFVQRLIDHTGFSEYSQQINPTHGEYVASDAPRIFI